VVPPSCIPIVAVQAPPLPDERRFYQAILAKVFAPFRPSKTAGNLQFEVVQLLSAVGTKMLIIDEIQHVLAGPMLKQRHFLNVIKYLGNELQIPIVAAGTHDAFNAVQSDPQLSNRFEPVVLRRWTMTDDYLRLLASFEVALPLERPSRLAQVTLARKILALSEGTIGGDLGAPHARGARRNRPWHRTDHDRVARWVRLHLPARPATALAASAYLRRFRIRSSRSGARCVLGTGGSGSR
jgi:hypothetical protein